MKGRDLLSPNETAIVICPGGDLFPIKPDETGSTGYKKVSLNRETDFVDIMAQKWNGESYNYSIEEMKLPIWANKLTR